MTTVPESKGGQDMAPYARRGVHGQTVEHLARRVLSGDLAEGATLDLAALQSELGVSLTALRESLKVLAAKGMVDARQRRGTFVRPRADWNLLDADVLRWQAAAGGTGGGTGTAGLLGDLHEIRCIVEPAAARLAAVRRTGPDLAALDAALAAMADAAGDPASAARSDLSFHRALLAATRNELLERMEMVIESGPAEHHAVHGSGHPGDPVPGHRAVLDAVRARDPDAAERALRALLGKTGRHRERAGARRSAGHEQK